MKRREFLAAGAAAAAVAMTNIELKAEVTDSTWDGKSANQTAKARLCLGSQLGIIPGNSVEEKFAKMKAWGIEAVEFGRDVEDPERAKYYKKLLDDTGLIPSAVCWGSHGGDLMSFDKDRKQRGTDALKRALEGAGIIGCTGVIYVPAFNGQSPLTNQEMRKMLLDDFPALADFAAECGTHITFEPLNRSEAFFLRQVADGAAIARDINAVQTGKIATEARLPAIVSGSVHWGFVFALICVVLVYIIFTKTTFGYKSRMNGLNPNFALYGGINARRMLYVVLIFSGALAGLGGAFEALGSKYRYIDQMIFTTGYAWSGMVAALLANCNPIGTAVASILLAGLSTGGSAMQRSTSIPVEVCNMIEGIIMLLMSVKLLHITIKNSKARKAAKEVEKA